MSTTTQRLILVAILALAATGDRPWLLLPCFLVCVRTRGCTDEPLVVPLHGVRGGGLHARGAASAAPRLVQAVVRGR